MAKQQLDKKHQKAQDAEESRKFMRILIGATLILILIVYLLSR